MKTIQIAEPIWKDRSVGLNIKDVSDDEEVHIEIMYVEKRSGRRTYPNKYKMLAREIRNYPTQTLKRNTEVYLVPISSLTEINEESERQFKLF